MASDNTKTIVTAITVVVVAVIIYLIVRNNSSPVRTDEQEAVTCGSKTVYRYKYPSEAFPVFTRDYNTEVSMTSDVLKRFSDSLGNAEIGVDAKNKVVELQEKLNQDNITFSTALRSYFINSNSDPCNDTLRQKFLAFTDEMTRRMLELKNTTAQVTNITPKGTETGATSTKGSDAGKGDTANAKPKYAIVKDTAAIKKSIYKLDELLQTNTKFNRLVNVLPPATRIQAHGNGN